jgi:hypothetical protein
VNPFARTTAAAPLTPSALGSCCVNAGSGAARVLVGADAPPFVVCDCVVVGVVAGVLVVRCAVVPPVWEGAGVLSTVTVFVEEPQPPRSPTPSSPTASILAVLASGRINPWYSPPDPLLLENR